MCKSNRGPLLQGPLSEDKEVMVMAWNKARWGLKYTSDKIIAGSNVHPGGNRNDLKGIAALVRKVIREHYEDNPREFIVFDRWEEDADGNPVRYKYNAGDFERLA